MISENVTQVVLPIILSIIMQSNDRIYSKDLISRPIIAAAITMNGGFNVTFSKVYLRRSMLVSVWLQVLALYFLKPFENSNTIPLSILPVVGLISAVLPLPISIQNLISFVIRFPPIMFYLVTQCYPDVKIAIEYWVIYGIGK